MAKNLAVYNKMRVERKGHTLLYNGAAIQVDFLAEIKRNDKLDDDGRLYVAQVLSVKPNAFQESIVCELVAALDVTERIAFLDRLKAVLLKELNEEAYSFYHVGEPTN